MDKKRNGKAAGENFFDFQYYMSLNSAKEHKKSVRIFSYQSFNHPTRHTYQFVEAENKYQTYTYRTEKDWKIY